MPYGDTKTMRFSGSGRKLRMRNEHLDCDRVVPDLHLCERRAGCLDYRRGITRGRWARTKRPPVLQVTRHLIKRYQAAILRHLLWYGCGGSTPRPRRRTNEQRACWSDHRPSFVRTETAASAAWKEQRRWPHSRVTAITDLLTQGVSLDVGQP
jgi:hypothetical protein